MCVCLNRKTTDVPRLRDEQEIQRQLEAKQEEIQNFRLFREAVEAERAQERIQRNNLKIQQLEQYERMQVNIGHGTLCLMASDLGMIKKSF